MSLKTTKLSDGTRLEVPQSVPSAQARSGTYRIGERITSGVREELAFSPKLSVLGIVCVVGGSFVPHWVTDIPIAVGIFLLLLTGPFQAYWMVGKGLMLVGMWMSNRAFHQRTSDHLVIELGAASLRVYGIGARDLGTFELLDEKIGYFSSDHPTRASRLSVAIEMDPLETGKWMLVLSHTRGAIRRLSGLELGKEGGVCALQRDHARHRIRCRAS